jgi:type I restriction enzyme, R subunit
MDLNEAKTRAVLINPRLEQAGWDLSDHSQVQFEVPVKGYDPTPWNGFTDFSLHHPDGSVLAVIEAKRTARNAREGEERLRQYVSEIAAKQAAAPFGFMTNGLHHYFWEVGLAHPRSIAGFFTPRDLERLWFVRENKRPLQEFLINKRIVERLYQHEAIRRVTEAFEAGKRRALLVMATGTGKTRTTMGLIDLLLQASWIQKALFLADRDALVEQALNDGFKVHLPNEPRVRIRSANIDPNKRLYVATQQTIGVCYEKFSPGFFDLIIYDVSDQGSHGGLVFEGDQPQLVSRKSAKRFMASDARHHNPLRKQCLRTAQTAAQGDSLCSTILGQLIRLCCRKIAAMHEGNLPFGDVRILL